MKVDTVRRSSDVVYVVGAGFSSGLGYPLTRTSSLMRGAAWSPTTENAWEGSYRFTIPNSTSTGRPRSLTLSNF